jgi:ADP-heptose:LPS heptosyltransferase
MADTAALIAQLDLVIAVDTAVAHLAGALGKPVWLLLPQRPDWRWPWAGAATHWYPTMRIFRARDVSWTAVVADVAASLRQWTQVPKRICADRV